YGKPIKSFTNGTVVYSGWGRPGTGYNNYGKVVAIKDEYGQTHVYAHLSNISVGLGSKVKAGTVIGHEGSTGRSTGSHLHYEIRRSGYGTDVNPTAYLKGYKGDPNFKPEIIASGDSSGSDASIQIGSMMTPSLLGGLPEFMPESLNVFNKIPSLAEQYLT
ncbi:M23 family metallopeptidase, partial [Brevibacillus sp. MCWH]|uniref:M23 family metallopeptidase n=1 Tax=Brevibacillus sp. MCWH TaxID=2508871 RepID=UPI0014918208